MSGAGRPGRLAGFRRWAAILLPIVIVARAGLLVFQIGSERKERAQADAPPTWPPVAGEVLRFRGNSPGIDAWAADPSNHPLAVAVTERDFLAQPPDTACLLNPAAMAKDGGRLTLRSATGTGTWLAEWSGRRTMPRRDDVGIDEPNAAIRAAEAAMLEAADCGGNARLELSEAEVHALVNLLGDQPMPPGTPAAPRRDLSIRATLPPAGR